MQAILDFDGKVSINSKQFVIFSIVKKNQGIMNKKLIGKEGFDRSFQPPPPGAMVPPMTNDTTGHYSFDSEHKKT